jgi:hypothetical protein
VPGSESPPFGSEICGVRDHGVKHGGTLIHLSRYHMDDIRIMLRIAHLSVSKAQNAPRKFIMAGSNADSFTGNMNTTGYIHDRDSEAQM